LQVLRRILLDENAGSDSVRDRKARLREMVMRVSEIYYQCVVRVR